MAPTPKGTMVGLTGGMGAGKTVALDIFRGLGAEVVDADDLVHRLYDSGGNVAPLVEERWGADAIAEDGRVERRAVARIVFADAGELRWLNSVTHPLVKRQLFDLAARPRARPAIVAVPLLYEVDWRDVFGAVISVWCDDQTQRSRLLRRGWDDREIRARTNAQMNMDQKLELADFGIINSATLECLREQCARIWHRLHDFGV